MKQLISVPLILSALLLTTSCASIRKSPSAPVTAEEIKPTYICASQAFINEQDYVLADPPVVKDKAQQDMLFRKWQAEGLAKYPSLKNAYGLLRECWETYHGKTK